MLKYRHLFFLNLLLLISVVGCSSIEKAESLYNTGDKEAALEMSISLLEDENAAIRIRAIKLISKIGGDKGGAALLGHLQDPNDKAQREIIVTLGQMQYVPAIENLLDLIPDANESKIRAFVTSFKSFGKPGIDQLVQRYDSPSESSNRGAYKAVLIRIGLDVAPAIISILKGKSFFENRENFDILKKVKNPRIARLMLPFLEDEEVADQVIEAVGQIGSGAVNATIDALNKMKGKDTNIPV